MVYPTFPLQLKAKLLPLRLRKKCCLLNLVNWKQLELLKGDGTFIIDDRNSNRTRGGVKIAGDFPKYEVFKKSV